jgi:rod shape-determining protein MreD
MNRGRAFDTETTSAWLIVLVALSMIVSMLLLAAPRPFGPVPAPLLPVMVLHFWTVARPGLIPAPLVFLTGILLDLLTGAPLGFWALGLLAVSATARTLRGQLLGADIWRRLLGVAASVAVVSLAALVAFGAAGRPFEPTWVQLVQLILTVLTYPLLEAVFFALGKGAGLGRGRT